MSICEPAPRASIIAACLIDLTVSTSIRLPAFSVWISQPVSVRRLFGPLS